MGNMKLQSSLEHEKHSTQQVNTIGHFWIISSVFFKVSQDVQPRPSYVILYFRPPFKRTGLVYY